MPITANNQHLMLQQMLNEGRVDDARAAVRRHLEIEPEDSDAYMLAGLIERRQGEWQKAIAAFEKAVSIAPFHVPYKENLYLCRVLKNDAACMHEGLIGFTEITAATPTALHSATNVVTLGLMTGQPRPILDVIPRVLDAAMPDDTRVILTTGLAIAAYLSEDLASASRYAEQASTLGYHLRERTGGQFSGDPLGYHIYAKFLHALTPFRAAHPDLYHTDGTEKPLHIIGESHCLTPAWMKLGKHRAIPHIIMGAKAYTLTTDGSPRWRYTLQQLVTSIPPDEPIVIGFGEIDCRSNEGFMEQYLKDPTFDLKKNIDALVREYMALLVSFDRPLRVVGVPAPNRSVKLAPEHQATFLGIIRDFNDALQRESKKAGFGFIDLYATTVDPEGWAKEGLHIDEVHLKPSVAHQALSL